MSSLPEFSEFLGIKYSDIGVNGVAKKSEAAETYHGSILPEESSGFPEGYKVVSFYADADALLQRAYVLRRSGWRSSQEAYQRMIISSKIEAIRANLRDTGQVAVNNIIATLPPDVLPVGPKGHSLPIQSLTETKPIKITLPLRANSVGLIDGQHRLFSYYRSKQDDPAIAKLRQQQNLLDTGIIYPENMKYHESEVFEASLFLKINSNQSSAPPELRQAIEALIDPFSLVSISKQIMQCLASTGPLVGAVERYFYDKGKLKTSSIVSFGLVPLIKLQGTDSLFSTFNHPEKLSIRKEIKILSDYVQHCVSSINIFLGAVRANVAAARWTTNSKEQKRILTVTFINGFLITMRMLIANGHKLEFDKVKMALSKFDTFDTKPFSSSQYNRMAEHIAKDYFNIHPTKK